MPESRLAEGRILCEKWRIDALLGEGGMATVWSGTHRNGLRVAIKALRAELSADQGLRERFLREGYVANRVGHPGVCTVHDDNVTDDGVVFIVMELLEGMTLKDKWLAEGRQLLPSEVVAVTMAILEVLAAAHAKGIVHRDLKPDNVFLLASGGIKILDFGIARLWEVETMDQRTRTGAMMGTPAFMPPEQALGHWDEVDARSDLFAVGATMWTLLTGALVHPAKTVQELLVAAATASARSIASVLPELDPRLSAVVDRALRFNTADRWPDAAAMRAALEPIAKAGRATDIMEARPAPPTDRLGVHGSWESMRKSAPQLARASAVHETPTELLQQDTPTKLLEQSSSGSAPQSNHNSLEPWPPAFDTGMPTTQPIGSLANRPGRRRWAVLAAATTVAALALFAVWTMSGAPPEPPPVAGPTEPSVAESHEPSIPDESDEPAQPLELEAIASAMPSTPKAEPQPRPPPFRSTPPLPRPPPKPAPPPEPAEAPPPRPVDCRVDLGNPQCWKQ